SRQWAIAAGMGVIDDHRGVMRVRLRAVGQGVGERVRHVGAAAWRVLFQMVVPMSKAVVAVVSLFYAVGYWNAFFNAILYINTPEKLPLQVVLRSFVLQGVSVPGQVDVGSGQVATLAVQMAVMVIAL